MEACYFFITPRGCRFGRKCRFFHAKPCPSFSKLGFCPRNDACTLIHNPRDYKKCPSCPRLVMNKEAHCGTKQCRQRQQSRQRKRRKPHLSIQTPGTQGSPWTPGPPRTQGPMLFSNPHEPPQENAVPVWSIDTTTEPYDPAHPEYETNTPSSPQYEPTSPSRPQSPQYHPTSPSRPSSPPQYNPSSPSYAQQPSGFSVYETNSPIPVNYHPYPPQRPQHTNQDSWYPNSPSIYQ